MDASNWIAIVDIIISICLGTWIAIVINKKFTEDRALKDYFISELSVLQSDYRRFVCEIMESRLDAKTIKDTFKLISSRIDTLNLLMHDTYELKDTLIKDAHAKFQQELTGVDELGEQYNEASVTLKSTTKTMLQPFQDKINESISRRIIDINKAKLCKKSKKMS